MTFDHLDSLYIEGLGEHMYAQKYVIFNRCFKVVYVLQINDLISLLPSPKTQPMNRLNGKDVGYLQPYVNAGFPFKVCISKCGENS